VPTSKPQPKPDDPEQYRRFVETARELEADESPGAMDRAFEQVVKPKRAGGITKKEKETQPIRKAQ